MLLPLTRSVPVWSGKNQSAHFLSSPIQASRYASQNPHTDKHFYLKAPAHDDKLQLVARLLVLSLLLSEVSAVFPLLFRCFHLLNLDDSKQ